VEEWKHTLLCNIQRVEKQFIIIRSFLIHDISGVVTRKTQRV